MYSQKWLNESVWYSPAHEDSIWWHWMVVVVPRNFHDDMKNKAYMQIEAGGNSGPPNIQTDMNIIAAKLLAISGMQCLRSHEKRH